MEGILKHSKEVNMVIDATISNFSLVQSPDS